MRWIKRGSLIILTTIGFTFSFNTSFAQNIKYSIGPFCKDSNIICTNPNETPTCLVLNPRIHIETIQDTDSNRVNRFEPHCGASTHNVLPTCVDISTDKSTSTEGVVLECIEFIKCQTNQDTNKLSAYCSEGKAPKCLGNDREPNCELDTICKNDAIPICDYVWQAFVPDSSYK